MVQHYFNSAHPHTLFLSITDSVFGCSRQIMQKRQAVHETIRKEVAIARANDTINACTPVNLPALHYHCLLGSCREIVNEPFPCPDCEAVVYCSAACLAKAQDDEVIEWNGVVPGHRQDCAQLKGFMSRAPELDAIAGQFPWTRRRDMRGKFRETIVLAEQGLLGIGNAFGVWGEHPGSRNDDLGDSEWLEPRTDEELWMLPGDEIPRWDFKSCRDAVPSFPPVFEDNWADYYRWRKLPIASPAALRLHWALSVFRCLEELGLVSRQAVHDGPRKELTVYYLGVEDEIYFLNVFRELALLLPNTDLTLVLYGTSAFVAMHYHLPPPSGQVLSYTAPESCGGGSIRVLLRGENTFSPSLDPHDYPDADAHPDALIALNAGLAAYPTWRQVMVYAMKFSIPFAVTDYQEKSLSMARQVCQTLLSSARDAPVQSGYLQWFHIAKSYEQAWKLNPFMRPGRMPAAGHNLPQAQNGFIMVVVPFTADFDSPTSFLLADYSNTS
ncbi:hypothetical protein BDZ89DRAFT_696009 [Hymenopellis radicata]|nr:hypothetical protein BDZ89DRAFT_696009 [Hymenopellis radicata]